MNHLTLIVGLLASVPAQQAQNPSPMVEHTRSHPRLIQEKPPGRREPLEWGSLFLPAALHPEGKVPLVVCFHCGTWLPEVAATRQGKCAVLSIQLGAGSGAYSKPFAEPDRFDRLLREAEMKGQVTFG